MPVPQKRTYRRRRVYRKKYAKKNDRHIRAVVRKEIKKEVESKFYDRVSTGSVANTVTVVSPHTSLVRGIGENNYVGSCIKPTWLTVRGQFQKAADSVEVFNQFRFMIIQDKDVTGVPTAATMFQDSTTYPWFSPLNKDFMMSYRVLYDKVFTLRFDAAGNNTPRNVKFKIPGSKLRKLDFTLASGNIQSGSIWFVMISDSSVATHPTFVLSSRMHFRDA